MTTPEALHAPPPSALDSAGAERTDVPRSPDTPVAPRRIQRKRTKGWRIPEGAVYVGRPSRWGNPFYAGDWWLGQPMTAGETVLRFRHRLEEFPREFLEPLRKRNLVCWCPLDQPCHADVLLELANA